MVVKQVFDHSLRESGKRFISSLKASNRYSEAYLASLETSVAMAALYAEQQQWPDVKEITTEHLEEYLAYLQDRTRWFGVRTCAEPKKLSKGHINAQYRRLHQWPDVKEITTEHLEEYLAYLQDRTRWFGVAEPKKLSKGHINAQYRRLHRFFNWLVDRGPIDENPMHPIKPPGLDEKTVPVVTEDQVRDLLTLADPALARTPAHRFRLVRDRALLYTLWDTPGRLAEIARLRLDDVDLTNGTLLVMGKGRKERRMPIGDAARSVVWDYLQEREALMPRTSLLWVSEQGEALLPNGISQVLKRLGKRAGIADLRPHRFRHSYAVNALRAGMPEQVLKIVGGWRKIPETYFRTLGEEDAKQFHRQVSPGDRLGRAASVGRARQRPGGGQPRSRL